MTSLSITTIRILNPSYKRDFIPASTKGNYLILPKRVVNDFNINFRRPDSRMVNRKPSGRRSTGAPLYTKSYYTVQDGDNLPFLAELFNCDPLHLKVWNNLKSDYVAPGQELLLFSPAYNSNSVTVEEGYTTTRDKVVAKLPILASKEVVSLQGSPVFNDKKEAQPKSYLYHTIQRNESLKAISIKYRVPIPILLEINGIHEGKLPKPGNRIKVRMVN